MLTACQVKNPMYNEIVTLTLGDGTQRAGQVLEARGMSSIERATLEATCHVRLLTLLCRQPRRCAGRTAPRKHTNRAVEMLMDHQVFEGTAGVDVKKVGTFQMNHRWTKTWTDGV